jgi:flavin-dependent dehydrogenase
MESCDVLIIGAGPAGSTSALILARAGIRVIVLEKSKFPRFHIGESILPRNFPLIQELGLEAQLKALPHVPKYGAEFGMGDDPNTRRFSFAEGLIPGSPTFNIERALFDNMLMDEARKAGADVRENTTVKQIVTLTDGAVTLLLADGTKLSAKYLLDASGHGCVVGRHLGLRKPIPDPRLHKVAYFGHFDNVERLPGIETGHPTIIMTREGWFWLIGINEKQTSVGFVCRPDFIKQVNVPPTGMLAWAIARCPVVRHRMRDATVAHSSLDPSQATVAWPDVKNEVLADFSYTCKPYAGPGYFLVGDAACFLDPIFSTGATLAMMAATQATKQTLAILNNQASPGQARADYINFVTKSTALFWRLIRNYYTHSFRELFMNGTGPMNVHGAIISILAGQVFPRPPFALRWRMWLFEACLHLNKYLPLVPRRHSFSLFDAEPSASDPRAPRQERAAAAV